MLPALQCTVINGASIECSVNITAAMVIREVRERYQDSDWTRTWRSSSPTSSLYAGRNQSLRSVNNLPEI